MKLVAIGDIHGRNIWQQIVEQEQPTTVVFVGDYFVRELDKYELQHLKKLRLLNNLAAIPTELINNFLTPSKIF